MKAVILAGGLGTRLSEETQEKPKPMVEIHGKPILWHILKILHTQGIKEFIICCGYRGYYIKEYFKNYALHNSNVVIHSLSNKIIVENNDSEDWSISCIDTGQNTQTGGRLREVKKYLGNEDFLFTYGDGVGDINLKNLINSHKKSKKLVTVTAVNPPGRFGAMDISQGGKVLNFEEKPTKGNTWINGGYFIINPKAVDLVKSADMPWEDYPLKTLTKKGQLNAYKHNGFWQPMDTLREKHFLEDLIKKNQAPWITW